MNRTYRFISILCCAFLIIAGFAGCAPSGEETTLYGRITAIEGSQITLALMQQPEEGGGAPPSGENALTPPSGDAAPPSGETPQAGEQPTQSAPALDDSQQSSGSSAPGGESDQPPALPSDGQGGAGSQPGEGSLTGEEKTLSIPDSAVITIQSAEGSATAQLSDLSVGDLLTVTLQGDTVTTVVVRQGGGMGAPGGMGTDDTGSGNLSGVFTVDGAEETSENQSYDATQADQSAVLVKNGGSLSLSGGTLSKTGDTSSADNSNFYAQNAILAVAGGSTAEISGAALTSAAEGANAIFATGEGSVITVSGTTISTTGNSSRGLDATYGGTIIADNMNISTTGAHCAPVATDRGGGTVTISGSTLSAAGDGSPCIYSTGAITATDVTGRATGSQAAVVEGKNSITLENCDLTGAGENGVMLYQSTSGDAEEGTAVFTAKNSTLSTTSSGPMFYITNTTAEAYLENTALHFESGILINAAGNSTNNWGTPGSNGGAFTLTATNQTLQGDVQCDSISSVSLVLKSASALLGAVNGENAGGVASVSLSADSAWTLTGDSYLSALENEDETCSNIQSGGFNLYYDSSNAANSWLGGQTLSLPGGGSLMPA